jgi:predicted RecA/RadA family phage recombinase
VPGNTGLLNFQKAMKNFVQPGNVLTITASADLTSGQLVKFGDLVGVAVGDIANGTKGAVSVTGVYEVPKKQADTVGAGQALYFETGQGRLTTSADDGVGETPAAFTLAGWAAEPAGNTATVVRVKLKG